MHMLYASSSRWDYIVLYLEQIVLRITKQIDGEAAHYDLYVRFLLGIGLIVFSWFSWQRWGLESVVSSLAS